MPVFEAYQPFVPRKMSFMGKGTGITIINAGVEWFAKVVLMCIDAKKSLQSILALSVAGILFSGYLSYGELFGKTCASCGSAGGILGLPACVYGLAMYMIIFCLAFSGLKSMEKEGKTTGRKKRR